MTGRLHKTKQGWVVSYNDSQGLFQFIQLHPEDVNEILDLEKVFDNVEARISAHPDIEFEIVEHQKMDGVVKYAKLIQREFVGQAYKIFKLIFNLKKNKMNKEFVPYEQALALKELGFDEDCFAFYDEEEYLFTVREQDDINEEWLIAPTFSQAFRWFREKHNLQTEMVFSEKPDRFYYYIGNMVTGDMDRGSDMSYEEAEQACLIKLINICKKK